MSPAIRHSLGLLGVGVVAAVVCAQSPTTDGSRSGLVVRCFEVPETEDGSAVLNRVVELGDERWLSVARAVEAIGAAARTPIYVHWRQLCEAGVEREAAVLIPPYATTLAGALKDAFAQASKDRITIHCEVKDDAVHIVTRDLAERTLVVRVYDVQPLLDRFEAWQRAAEERHARHLERLCTLCPPLRHRRNPGKLGMGKERFSCLGRYVEEPVAAYADAVSQLTDLIERAVEPDCWRVNGGGGHCQCIAGRLIVRQPAHVQRQVAAFLETLAVSWAERPDATEKPQPSDGDDTVRAEPRPGS